MTTTNTSIRASPTSSIDESAITDPLQQWRQAFKDDAHTLTHLLSLRTRPNDKRARDEMEPTLSGITSRLTQLEFVTDSLNRQLESEENRIKQLEDFHRLVASQKKRIEKIQAVLPSAVQDKFNSSPDARLPQISSSVNDKQQQQQQQMKENKNSTSNREDIVSKKLTSRSASVTEEHVKVKQQKPKNENFNKTKLSASSSTQATTKTTRPVKKSASSSTPTSSEVIIRSVTKSELNSAPQYVRGRITVEKLDIVSSKLSKIATTKYGLLKRPNSALSPAELSHCLEFQQANCAETTGYKFLTENEIKTFGQYRIDSTVRSAINVLRHVGILKEIRGKNSLRILLICDSV